MEGQATSKRLQKHIRKPKYFRSTNERLLDEEYFCHFEINNQEMVVNRVDFYWPSKKTLDGEKLFFFSTQSSVFNGILDACIELTQRKGSEKALTSREVDYFLRDHNDIPCMENQELIQKPIEALKAWALYYKAVNAVAEVDFTTISFLQLNLQHQLLWLKKAIAQFAVQEGFCVYGLKLVALVDQSVIVRGQKVELSKESLIERLTDYLVDFFKENSLNVIVD